MTMSPRTSRPYCSTSAVGNGADSRVTRSVGLRPISLREFRMRSTDAMKALYIAASTGKAGNSTASGHDAVTMVEPSCGNVCQISSVTNGSIGCSARTNVLNTNESTAARVACCDGALLDSKYQSQKRYQPKSCNRCDAGPIWYVSSDAVTSATHCCSSVRIHLSAIVSSDGGGSLNAVGKPSGSEQIKRSAFQSLVLKRFASSHTRSSNRSSCDSSRICISVPRRNPSAPYFAIISNGSIAFPSDLLILRP